MKLKLEDKTKNRLKRRTRMSHLEMAKVTNNRTKTLKMIKRTNKTKKTKMIKMTKKKSNRQ